MHYFHVLTERTRVSELLPTLRADELLHRCVRVRVLLEIGSRLEALVAERTRVLVDAAVRLFVLLEAVTRRERLAGTPRAAPPRGRGRHSAAALGRATS